jgi:hypothetical protein
MWQRDSDWLLKAFEGGAGNLLWGPLAEEYERIHYPTALF